MKFTIRPAVGSDSKAIWMINNEPSVREVSFSPEAITWDSHENWFSESLRNPDRVFFVASIGGQVVGVSRFDLKSDQYFEISVAISSSTRGKRLGRAFISQSSLACLGSRPEAKGIRAFIKSHNSASRKAFEAASYKLKGSTITHGVPVLEFYFAGGISGD